MPPLFLRLRSFLCVSLDFVPRRANVLFPLFPNFVLFLPFFCFFFPVAVWLVLSIFIYFPPKKAFPESHLSFPPLPLKLEGFSDSVSRTYCADGVKLFSFPDCMGFFSSILSLSSQFARSYPGRRKVRFLTVFPVGDTLFFFRYGLFFHLPHFEILFSVCTVLGFLWV